MLTQREIDVIKRHRPTVNKTEPIVVHTSKVTWSGGLASLAVTVTGALTGDKVQATINVAPTEAAYLVSAVVSAKDTVTLTLSAANTSNDAEISIQLSR